LGWHFIAAKAFLHVPAARLHIIVIPDGAKRRSGIWQD